MFKLMALLASGEVADAAGRRMRLAGAYALAVVFVLLSLVFALIGARDWFMVHMSPALANLLVAGVLLVVAGLVVLVGTTLTNRRRRKSLSSAALFAAPLALRSIGVRNMGTAAVLATLVGGAVIGRKLTR